MNDPLTCKLNNQKWSHGSSKSDAVPLSPFEVSNMRNHNPCSRCKSRKSCRHVPVPHTPHKKVKYVNIPKSGNVPPVIVKGELINGRKQTGLKPVLSFKPDGTPKITIEKPFYPRLSDSHVKVHSPKTPQVPISPKPTDSKYRHFTR
jgi:hypothetical protein